MLTFTVATKPFISALSTAFKAAQSSAKTGTPILAMAQIHVEGNRLRVVATDKYIAVDASLDLDTPADTSGAFLLSRHQFSAIELWWKANRRRPCAHITVADDGSVRLFDQPVALPHGETGQYPAIDRLVREPEWRQFEGVSGLPAVGFSASNLAKLSAIVKASGGKSINFGAPKEARGGMRTGAVQFIVDQPVEGLHVQGAVMPTRIGTRVARWKA